MSDLPAPDAIPPLAPRMGAYPEGWQPLSLAQRDALACQADILLFGGAAGSLKSETMLVDAILERANPKLRAILFRRSYPELEKSLIHLSRELYARCDGRYNEQKRTWTFRSGATVEFAYCEGDKDIYRYQGAEYSFIGFDESTHFGEFPIRYMLSRLRSTDPALALRMRLATNPGNVGHNFHKAIFHGQVCTHCRLLPESRRPRKIYDDALWPSDRKPIRKSTCFIPGRLQDHQIFGAAYQESLASLPEVFRKALLDGCWDVYEGQFFNIWNPERMVARRPTIQVEPSWPHWAGIDYGFAGSQAAAYLLAKGPATAGHPEGRIYVLDEYTAERQKASDFACELRRRFGAQRHGDAAVGQPIVARWFLSPDAWANRGEDHSLADQMREAAKIEFEPAATDRRGGAMLLYTALSDGNLVIADTCRQLIEAIPTRNHDPDRPDDILKVAGDPLDDCIDALRYAMYSSQPAARRPDERIAKAMTSPDPTVAMLQRRTAEDHCQSDQYAKRFIGSRRR